MYGSAMNSPDNQYQIVEGWFSEAKSLYDPDNIFVSDLINPGHNFYGFIDARYNFQVCFVFVLFVFCVYSLYIIYK